MDRWYTEALNADPEFSRARFGIAEVQFQRGSDECGINASDEAIAELRGALIKYGEAFDSYRAGIASGSTDPVRFLEIKAQLGLGRVRLCLGSVGDPTGAEARSDFLAVIVDYESADSLDQVILDPVASEAYAGLAFSYMLEGDTPDQLTQAVDALTTAMELNPANSRLVLFLALRAWVYEQLGMAEEADADCDAVKDIDEDGFSCPLGPDTRFYDPVALSLPFTGTDYGALVAVALWLVGIGAAAVWLARNRIEATPLTNGERRPI